MAAQPRINVVRSAAQSVVEIVGCEERSAKRRGLPVVPRTATSMHSIIGLHHVAANNEPYSPWDTRC